jgi:hypothetical protein
LISNMLIARSRFVAQQSGVLWWSPLGVPVSVAGYAWSRVKASMGPRVVQAHGREARLYV